MNPWDAIGWLLFAILLYLTAQEVAYTVAGWVVRTDHLPEWAYRWAFRVRP